MLINYRVPALVNGQRPYKTYEARHLFNSEDPPAEREKPIVDPAEFKDKIVFIGTSAAALSDVFQTPFGKATMPGIQLHASMADSVLSNRFIRRAEPASQLGVTVLAAVAVGVATAMLPFTAAALAALAAIGAWSWVSLVLFRGGLWIDLVQPVAAIAVALFGGTAYRYFVEDREKRKMRHLFGRYVAKDVCEQLIANPNLAELGGKRREMTVLFSDIRGFTTVTEKGDPEALVAQLNEYFSRMVDVVFRHHGTIDKFVGDMVMALFGAPLDDEAHADHAAAAACDMVKELGELNRKWAAEGRAQLDIGVGINSGDMIAGNIGSSSIMSYTVIGDNVNLGARLESLNKEYGTRIIISDATRARLKGAYDIRPLGDVVVKGKTRPVAIFELRVPSPLGSTGTNHMKKTALALALVGLMLPAAAAPRSRSSAASTRRSARRRRPRRRTDKVKGLVITRRRRAQDRREDQRGADRPVRRLPGHGRDEVRVARRQRARAGQLAAEPEVGIHRARHRRRQRLRGAGRSRAHHARRARPDQERSGTGRRARARDHARHREAHDQRDPRPERQEPGRGAAGDKAGGSAGDAIDLLGNAGFNFLYNGAFSRGDEMESDKVGIALANKVGYAPTGMVRGPHTRSPSATRIRRSPTAGSPRIPRSKSASRRWRSRSRTTS